MATHRVRDKNGDLGAGDGRHVLGYEGGAIEVGGGGDGVRAGERTEAMERKRMQGGESPSTPMARACPIFNKLPVVTDAEEGVRRNEL